MNNLPNNKIKLTDYNKNGTGGSFIFYLRDYYDANICYKHAEHFYSGTWYSTDLRLKSYIDTVKEWQFR